MCLHSLKASKHTHASYMPRHKGQGKVRLKDRRSTYDCGGVTFVVTIVFKWKMLVSHTEKNEYRKVVQVKLNGCIDEEIISVKTERLCGEGGSPRQHGRLGSLSFQEPPGSYLSLSLLF